MKRVISPVPSVISRGKGAAGYSPRIDGLHDGAIGRRMGTAKSSQEKNEACGRLASQTRFAMRADAGILHQASESEPLVGVATRRESSNVCIWRGLAIDYQ